MREKQSNQVVNSKIDFILKVVVALHQYGTASHRLEGAITSLATQMGLKGSCFSTPTFLLCSFEKNGEQKNYTMRVQPGGIELEKLSQVDQVANMVLSGALDPVAGGVQIKQIQGQADRYHQVVKIIAFGLIGLSFSFLLKSNLPTILAAAIGGVCIGVGSQLIGLVPQMTRLFEAIMAFSISFYAYYLATIFPSISSEVVIIASLIVIIPGLTVTTAIAELATQNLVSGTARLMGGGMTLLQIVFGVILGKSCLQFFVSTEVVTLAFQQGYPFWLLLICTMTSSLSLVVLFNAHPRDSLWILLACLGGYYGFQFTKGIFGSEMATFAGGTLVGAGSNVFARVFNRPVLTTQLPGIIFLVPGGIGFKGIQLLANKDTLSGIDMIFSMIILAVALVAGLFFGNILINPRRNI